MSEYPPLCKPPPVLKTFPHERLFGQQPVELRRLPYLAGERQLTEETNYLIRDPKTALSYGQVDYGLYFPLAGE
jgi:hypothetical protein